ncbi:hypothetical protein SAMN06265338_103306 [Rhodoblastus acidophilus]|uniref:UPF0178 protein SAMN06265338_103306 n=1 Tax=Rhodoblastus acidophilus TaxID=1074 RepID=A0A212RC82_RHOAC|nr:YaiI/YqxD family protein [Rhodoblastus acidophilus]MCW2317187.1 uncharacterized protein YaiI (UPF0178 family) [Rhodoblastus acidophilus]PPQ39453.1 DUF188 domain-containing protein [Rhodoblastus acidophilus]RAI19475.1 DUF188 domain-containing protein [Rhodoblastus acidophilus]SNB69882.1 hypothetical protein SAMN06265338_103306 [Rhodoblastus acidophilus]
MELELFVDADACPVKDECYKVAARHGLKVFLVANRLFQAPRHPMIERVLVPQGPDVADDWIAERADARKIVVTADIPLAARCVKAGAFVLAPNGKIFDDSSIGMALAMRNLMDDLRSSGEVTGGPKGFSPRDRSAFLSALERCVQQARKRMAPG